MSSLRRFLERMGSDGSTRQKVRDVADRVRKRTRRRRRRDRPAGRPAKRPARNRYIDPRTEDRDRGDDTHWLGERTRIQVHYAPDDNGDPDPGEVVWTWIPYEEDPTKGKDRPAIIIGRTGNDLVGVPLTTKPRHNETNVEIGSGAWDSRGRVSFACIDRVMAVDPEAVRREGAVLARDRFESVIRAVDEHYDIIRLPDEN